MSEPPIEFERLTKFYGKRRGVEDVSFRVEPGQTMGFLGPNGSGKTTVIRVLMGLIGATSGRARILGQLVTLDGAATRREIGYLPGTLVLYSNLTARQLLTFASELRGRRGLDSIESLAERFALPLDTKIGEMSKGTKQKVGVVQAFMHSPRILVLDEPTSGLDPLVQREFENLLHEHTDLGAAVLLSSHVLSEVERIASHVAILNDGRLVARDEVKRLTAQIERRIRFTFAAAPEPTVFDSCPGVRTVKREDGLLEVSVTGPETDVLAVAARHGAISVESHEPTLDDVFVSRTGTRRDT